MLLRLFTIGFTWAMTAGLAGCGPAAQVRLLQPQYAGAEQDICLQTNLVRWAPGDGVARFLAEFPLPGAVSGRPTYLLYLRVPMDLSPQTQPAGAAQGVCGFLIQTQGQNAGLEFLKAAQVSMKGKGSAPDARRELRVELIFEGSTTLTGWLKATRDDRYLKIFETRRRPSDVQALLEDSRRGDSVFREVP